MVYVRVAVRLLLIAAALIVTGCATNAMTGRSQLMLVSEEQAIQGSASAYSSMIGGFAKKQRLEQATARVERVKEITNRLIAEAVRFRPDSGNWNWEVQVIDAPKTVNAFCMAGGKMGIYTGFWEKLHATDDEVAAVMGHEIGHALASHTRERMSVGLAAGVATTVLAVALSNGRNYERNSAGIGAAAALAVTLPNSREGESEADQIGVELAARAGYDPRAAVTLWEKMAKEGGGRLEFLSTHPSPENRAQALAALIEKVEPLYERTKSNPARDIPDFLSANPSERPAGTVSRDDYIAKIASEPEVMTFLSADFDRFKSGAAVFKCTTECALAYAFQKSAWKNLHEKQQWRELALRVMKVGYENDLSYFLLAEAAKGLGFGDAAAVYYKHAVEAASAGKTCGGAFNTCEGFSLAETKAPM